MWCRVRMLCRRSASFTSRTRMSDDIASTSLRNLGSWCSPIGPPDATAVTPSTSWATFSPNRPGDLLRVASVSSKRVVEQAGDDRRRRASSRQDAGDLDRMGLVARGPKLSTVLLQPIDVGAIQHLLVRFRMVGLHARSTSSN